MSSISTGRIKQIRTRSNNDFSTGVPIGTDGILVDMLSELDLEEEIRLGGNHYVDIVQTDTATEIKEWYFSEPRGTRTITEMSEYVTYSALVSIISAVDIPLGQTVQDGTFVTQEVNGDIIVSRQAISSNEQRIEINLYKYDMDNGGTLLHSKTVYIYEDPLTDRVIIDEQMGENGDTNNPLVSEENTKSEQGEQEGGNEP